MCEEGFRLAMTIQIELPRIVRAQKKNVGGIFDGSHENWKTQWNESAIKAGARARKA